MNPWKNCMGLLHDDGVGAFADFNVTLVGRIGQLGEVAARLIARQIGVPFGVNKERRNADVGRVVLRLAGNPVGAKVLQHAIRRPQHRRRLFGADRIGWVDRPIVRTIRADEIGLLVLGNAFEPALLGGILETVR